VAALRSVKGIGEKSAQRIIIDLKGKLGNENSASSSLAFTGDNKMREEALSALVMLGFAKNVAEKAIDKSLKSEGNALSVEHLIKLALKNL
jgi:Holliday junction DNA helicase RuvA